jgi:hypothetical protein
MSSISMVSYNYKERISCFRLTNFRARDWRHDLVAKSDIEVTKIFISSYRYETDSPRSSWVGYI